MPGMKTGKLSEIRLDAPESWNHKVFLTFDIDWAHDEVIQHSISLIEGADAHATWFVTHDTPLLDRLRSNPKFELGIHPNFNFLLEGDDRNGRTAEEVLDRVMAIVPEAKSVRSHSVTTSSKLLELFASRNLTHESNHYIPPTNGMELRPWDSMLGLTVAPFTWVDALASTESKAPAMKDILHHPGIKILDFHPIHIFLNTEDMSRYESTRELHYKPTELMKHRSNHSTGSEAMLASVLDLCQ